MERIEVQKQDPRLDVLSKLLNDDHKDTVGYIAWDSGLIKSQLIKAFETGGVQKAKRYVEYISSETPLDLILEPETAKKVFELLEMNKED